MKKLYALFIALYLVNFNAFSQNKTTATQKITPSNTIIVDPGTGGGGGGTDPLPSTEVGKTEGKLNISLTGGATYSVPVAVPPGINGVEPKIGLYYNSQGGVGLAGYGWNISGLSAITRIPATKFHDGVNDPVDFNTLDRFALDGQRLLLKTGTYGVVGSTYGTENYSNIKVTLTGNYTYTSGTDVNGTLTPIPCKLIFKVEYPDGSVAYYGNSIDSCTYTTSALTSWENAQGIKINYFYTNTSTTIDSGNYLYINSIKYGGTGVSASLNEVQFIYKNRANAEQSFQKFEILNDKVLSEIKVLGNTVGYRNYLLTHNIATGYERLIKIQEKSGDGLKSLSPINFNYESNTTGISYIGIGGSDKDGSTIADYDGDGKLDYIRTNYNSSANTNDLILINNFNMGTPSGVTILTIPYVYDTQIFPLNYIDTFLGGQKRANKNGFVVYNLDQTTKQMFFKMYAMNSNGIFSLISTRVINYTTTASKIKEGDFNGDGLTDVIVYVDGQYKLLNLDTRITSNYTTNLSNISLFGWDSNSKVGDVNGDGKTDLINVINFNNSSLVRVYTLDATNTNLIKFIEHNNELASPIGSTPPRKSILQGDFNGDGKTDLWFTSSRKILYSTGSGFKIENDKVAISSDTNVNTLVTDINKDGKSDVITVTKTATPYNYIPLVHGCQPICGVCIDELAIYGHYLNDCPYKHDMTYSKLSFTISTLINSGQTWITNASFTQSTTLVEATSSAWPVGAGYGITYFAPLVVETDDDTFTNYLSVSTGGSTYKFNFGNTGNERVLNSVENNGENYTIEYKSLKNSSVYTSAGQIEDYPNYDFPASLGYKVVSQLTYSSTNVSKTQQFSYYGGVSNTEGLGFFGFRSVARTNWFNDPAQMTTTVTKLDMSKRGAPVESFTMLGTIAPNYSITPSDSFINHTLITYNNEDTSLVNPLLADKTYKLFKTKEVNYNGLENTSSETTTQYTANNSPQLVTQTIKNNGAVEQTSTTTLGYAPSVSAPYMVDRPVSKNVTITAGSDTTTSEELYTVYDANLLKQIKKKQNTTNYITEDNEYDLYGNITKKTLTATGLAPRVTSFEYDTTKRFLTKKIDIEGLETIYTYNPNNGWLLSETLPSNNGSPLKTTFTYDVWGKVTKKIDYLGKAENYTYANSYDGGFSKTMLHDSGSSSKITYDELGREIRREALNIDGTWSTVDTQYDIYDRVIRKSQPYIGTETAWNEIQYDVYGRVSQSITAKSLNSLGKNTSYSYSGLSVTENDGFKTKVTQNNALGKPVTVTETPGGQISYTYFANGNLKTNTFSGGTITIQQDGWGRKSDLQDPSAGNRHYDYNDFGELTKETIVGKGEINYNLTPVGKPDTTIIKDAAGVVTGTKTYTYDPTTKLLTKLRFDDTANTTFTEYNYSYDNFKRLFITDENTGSRAQFTKTITFDAFGRPDSETYYALNKADNKSSSKTVSHTYKNGAHWQIIDNDTFTTLWQTNTVNAQGQIQTGAYGNGIAVTNTFDDLSFPTQNKHLKGTTNVMTLTNVFEPIRGNLTSRTNSMFASWSETLTYDNLDRLTAFKDINGAQTQVYNDNGTIDSNRQGKYAYNISGKPFQVSTVTPVDQTATSPVLNYYIPRPQTITYNVYKSPVTITEAGVETIDFEYNAFNTRTAMYYGGTQVTKTARPNRKYYSADGTMEIKIKSTAPASVEFITYIGGDAYDAPVILKSDGTTQNYFYLHRDYQNTIVAITNANGVVVEKRLFDVWGGLIQYANNAGVTTVPTSSTGLFLDRGYTGHEHLLGVNIINMNGRIYDYKLHRFLQPDNNIQAPTNTQNYNRYGYCMNNPTKYTDKSGEFWWLFAAGALFSIYVHGGQATGDPNPLNWNASTYLGAVSAAVSPAVFNYVSNVVTDFTNSYILNYGQPSAAQMAYMAQNPIKNSVEGHGYVSNNGNGYLNEDTFVNGIREHNDRITNGYFDTGRKLGMMGIATDLGAYKMFNNNTWYSVKQFKTYSQDFNGNGFTGGKIASALKISNNFKSAGKIIGYGGIIWDGYNTYNDYNTYNTIDSNGNRGMSGGRLSYHIGSTVGGYLATAGAGSVAGSEFPIVGNIAGFIFGSFAWMGEVSYDYWNNTIWPQFNQFDNALNSGWRPTR